MSKGKLLTVQLGDASVRIIIGENAEENWKLVRDLVDNWIEKVKEKQKQ